MNIENIRAYLEVTSTGSFQQAAENLSITQSAMSARIKGLEDLLNRQLFNRKRNGATLTSGGQAFYKHALTIVQTWELAKQETALSDGVNSIVGLGVQLNHWQSIAAPWLKWMNENVGDVATQIHSDYSSRLMAMLRDGLINLAVLYEPQRNPDMIIEEFTREDIVLVSSVPRAVQRALVKGYVYVDWGHRFRLEHTAAYPDNPSYQMTVGMASVGLGQILEQGGSAYLLESEVKHHVDAGDLFLVNGAKRFTLITYLAYFRDALENPAVESALNALRQIQRPVPAKEKE